jgi:putative peptidoglycan lipid II flippase
LVGTDAALNESLHQVSKNVRLVSLCTMASRVLGLMRDQAMSVLFGAGPVMDAFTVAFRLPNLARVLLGEGALTTAFLPVFVAELHERGRESAARVTWAVLISVMAFLSILIVLIEVILWSFLWFAHLSHEAELLCHLTAILMPYVILICLAAQVGTVLNGIGRFLWPALVPAVLNMVWLASLWTIVPLWSNEQSRVYVAACCVIVGGVLQFLFPLPVLYASGFGYRSDWRLAIDRVWKIASDMLPVVIGLSITQLNAVLDSFIAWSFTQPNDPAAVMSFPGSFPYPLREGTATALYLGQRLYQFPLGVFGVALGTVLFPLLTSHAQKGEFDKLRSDLSLGVRLVIAIGVPASVGLVLIAHPLATLFFQYGKFNVDDARYTGDMIAAYGSGVWAYCSLLILQRGFYAVGDRMTPLTVGMYAMVANIVMDLGLMWPLGGRGLALSTAVIAALQCIATARLLQRKVGRLLWSEIFATSLKTIVASMVMAAVCLSALSLLQPEGSFFARLIRLGIPLLAGIVAFMVTAKLSGLNEPWVLVAGRLGQRSE